jgi:hypothetical protein
MTETQVSDDENVYLYNRIIITIFISFIHLTYSAINIFFSGNERHTPF